MSRSRLDAAMVGFDGPPPALAPQTIRDIAKRAYGLDIAQLATLGGERDQNCLATDEGGRRFLVRVTNPAESRAVTSLVTQALLHLERTAPAIPVQRIVPIQGGEPWVMVPLDGAEAVLRVMTYLEGRPLSAWPEPSLPQCAALGDLLARFHRAMQTFSHPASEHDLLWNVAEAGRIRPLVDGLADPDLRRDCHTLLDRFEDETRPALARLPRQVIHNDPNLHNILMDLSDPAKASGIIDLGDIRAAPRIVDLCIAIAALPLDAGLANARALIGAYAGLFPLEDEAEGLLSGLVGARLTMTMAITEYRARLQPENATYILKNAARSAGNIRMLIGMGASWPDDLFATACRESTNGHV